MSVLACQEARKRFDVFLDGELDGRTMRDIALHVTRCAVCEEELRQVERMQEILSRAIEGEIDRVNVAALWGAVEERMERPRRSPWARMRERWEEPHALAVPVAGFATVALGVAALFIVSPWRSGESVVSSSSVAPSREVYAGQSNAARIERLESSVDNVVVWSESERDTTAIWVVDYSQ